MMVVATMKATVTATSTKTKSTSRAKTKVDPLVTATGTIAKDGVVMLKNQRTKQNHRRWLTRSSFPSVVKQLLLQQQSPLAIVGLFLLSFATVIVPSWGQGASSSSLNRAPHFVPGQDMSRFSLSESTPVDSPVYQLRGEKTRLFNFVGCKNM